MMSTSLSLCVRHVFAILVVESVIASGFPQHNASRNLTTSIFTPLRTCRAYSPSEAPQISRLHHPELHSSWPDSLLPLSVTSCCLLALLVCEGRLLGRLSWKLAGVEVMKVYPVAVSIVRKGVDKHRVEKKLYFPPFTLTVLL